MKGENMDKNELLEEQEFIIWKKFEEFKKAYCEFIKNIDIGIYFDEFDEIDEIEVEDFELLWILILKTSILMAEKNLGNITILNTYTG